MLIQSQRDAPGKHGLATDHLNIWFGEALQDARENIVGWSQSKLARRLDMNHSTISRYESGDRFPSREVVTRMAAVMGMASERSNRLYLSAGFWPFDEVPSVAAMALIEGIVFAPIDDQDVAVLADMLQAMIRRAEQ